MFVDFGKKVHDRCARCDENEVFGSVRKVTIGDKSVDGVGDGGLISGCQIPVNPTMKSTVTVSHSVTSSVIVCGLHPGIGQPPKLPMHHPYPQV